MRRYSNVQALLFSFLQREVYRDAAGHWRGTGLVYVLVLAAIVAVLAALRIEMSVSRWANRDAPRVIAQLPAITIDHGHVAIDRPSPVVLRDPDTGKPAAIIDTTGTVTSLEGTDAYLLLTRDHLVYRKTAAETRVFDLSRVQHFAVDQARATHWTRLAVVWLPIVVFPFILLFMFVARLFQQLIAALAVLVVGRARSLALDFAACMRLAALAITPATLALDLAGFAGLKVPWSGTLWCLITLAYVVLAIAACRAAPADAPDDAAAAAH